MPRYSLMIRFKEYEFILEGNEDIIWFIGDAKTLDFILNRLLEYKKMKKRKKMNILLINPPSEVEKIINKYKEEFNFIIDKSYQNKITKFIR